MRCFEVILGLEEGDFGSKNETRGGMEGGIVEKRADGLGVFQTLSIYVKYPPCLYRRFSPFSAVFLSLSSRLAAVLPCFVYLVSRYFWRRLPCYAFMFPVFSNYSFYFNNPLNSFQYYILQLSTLHYYHAFTLYIPTIHNFFLYHTFPFYLHHPFYHLLLYPSCTLLYRFMLLYMFYQYNHIGLLLSI